MEKAFCSFCGKAQAKVRRLVSSPSTDCYICDTCVEICREILNESPLNRRSERLALPTPMEIKQQLDEYIVGQDNAKRAMAVAVYNHYKRLNYNLHRTTKQKTVELDKSNILLIGPTGVGKTLIAKTLARILKVPFVCVDATTLTEAGYVGDDVESALAKLLANANYDTAQAEMGIVYIDEVDKIAKKVDSRNLTRDVSGEGVQQSLLKILEGTIVQVGQNSRKSPHQDTISMDTSNILFICGGAFVKLESIVQNREAQKKVGFNQEEKVNKNYNYKFIDNVQPNDLVEFGLIPEFVGRLPVVVGLDSLDKASMINILTKPKNNLVDQYKTFFRLDGIELDLQEDAISAIAQKALDLGMGARGLRTIMEEVMLDAMYASPSEKDLEKVSIDENCITEKTEPLYAYKQPSKLAKSQE